LYRNPRLEKSTTLHNLAESDPFFLDSSYGCWLAPDDDDDATTPEPPNDPPPCYRVPREQWSDPG
jgi:hypothetical protein